MQYTDVFAQIDAMQEEYFGVWEQICDLESPTEDKARVDAVGRFVTGMADRNGWRVEVCRQEKSGDVVVVTMNPAGEGKPLIVSGHIDTVHPVGRFGPKPTRRDGEKIYGPGVTDCKGGVVAGLLAMDALQRCGYTGRPVQLILQTDEECSSRQSGGATIRYICARALEGELFLNLETHGPGTTTTKRKGVATIVFRIKGVEGHSSRCVTEGASAIRDAAYKIIELEKLKDDDGLTCSCGIIQGGTADNTIPGSCTVTANFRFTTPEQWDWLQNFLKELCGTAHVPGCSCTYELLGYRPAMVEEERNLAVLERVNAILEQTGQLQLKPKFLRGGSDAANVSAAGATCLDSLGTRGGGSHSIKEFAWLESLAEAAKRVAAVALYL